MEFGEKIGANRLRLFGLRRSRKVIWNQKKMHPKRMTEPKVMAFWSFRIFTCILCLSNYLGCSFSLYLPVDLAKTYENEWSQCSNDQSIKNLWLPEVRNLLMQCYATQYCNGTSICLQYGLKLPWPSFYNVPH